MQPTEQGASTSNFTRSYNPPPRFSSEPLGDIVGAAIDLHQHRARTKAAAPYSARPQSLLLHCGRALPETQFSEDGHLDTSRDVTDENGLVDPARNVDSIDNRERRHQEANSMASIRVSTPELSPATTHDKARCDIQSDDELNNTESAKDRRELYLVKRKRLSSSFDGQKHKKRKYHLQQKSACRPKPCSKSYRRTPKSDSVLDQVSRVAMGFSTDGRLPSPAPSVPQDIYSEVLSDRSDLDTSPQNVLPTLVEITFRLHSLQCYSFTAIIRDSCHRRGVSFGQVSQLIGSTGHVGRIDDYTIKPIEQHAFFVTGFSRQVLPRVSSSGMTS